MVRRARRSGASKHAPQDGVSDDARKSRQTDRLNCFVAEFIVCPADSKYLRDYYNLVATIPTDEAFIPLESALLSGRAGRGTPYLPSPRASPSAGNIFRAAEGWPSLMSAIRGATTMRSSVRKFAHVLERSGLAMAGAASGLFVAAHVGSIISALTSQAFILIMMISGAVGFYQGIDTPPLAFHGPDHQPSRGSIAKIDSAEFLSAMGTFLAALAAFVSVGVIVLREDLHIFWTTAILLGWVVGVTMQIIAGAIARARS